MSVDNDSGVGSTGGRMASGPRPIEGTSEGYRVACAADTESTTEGEGVRS